MEFLHSALLLEVPSKYNRVDKRIYYATNAKDKSEDIFDARNFREETLKIIERKEIGKVNFNHPSFYEFCYDYTYGEFVNLDLANNWQSWCRGVLDKIPITHDFVPESQQCGVLFILTLSSSSSTEIVRKNEKHSSLLSMQLGRIAQSN